MGLRGAVVFIPLTCALWFPGRLDRRFALLSTVCGPLGVLFGKLLGPGIDPLFVGMGISLLMACLGCIPGGKYKNTRPPAKQGGE